MAIIKNPSKMAKNGYTYEVNVSYYVDGMRKRYRKRGFTKKKDALAHEQEIISQIKGFGKPQANRNLNPTLDTVYHEFLKVGASQFKENTVNNTKRYYNTFESSLGHIRVKDLTYQVLQQYFNSQSDKGKATNSNTKKALNRILNYAVKCDYIQSNPLSLVVVTGKEKERNREEVLSYDDLMRIVDYLNDIDFKRQSYAIALQIAYFQGLRLAECMALDKTDVDFEKGVIHLNKSLVYQHIKVKELHTEDRLKTKSSKTDMPLADITKQILLSWFEVNPYDRIICNESGWFIHPTIMESDLRKYTRLLGIDFHFHQLRHTFCTNIYLSGASIKDAQLLMRHSNVATTLNTYTHLKLEHQRDVLNNVFSQGGTKMVPNENGNNIPNEPTSQNVLIS